MIRLFVALKIPYEVRNEIVNLRNKVIVDYKNYKWESIEKIHLTLKFIGEVKDELLGPISNALNFIKEYKSINCKLNSFDFFYNNDKPKILWIGLETGEEIVNLVKDINNELEYFSIPAEKRKFKSHLTIKRLRGDENKFFVQSFKNFKVPEIQFTSNEITLMKSELFPTGSVYTEIENYKLK